MSLAFRSDACRSRPPVDAEVKAAEILGGTLIGRRPSAPPTPRWPEQTVVAPLLGYPGEAVHELWISAGDCRPGEFEGIAFRRSREVLFGVIELDEQAFSTTGRESALQQATGEAYRRIFRLLAAQELPHLWRVWNYLADINGETNGLERYRQFNIGRHDAFAACARAATGDVPAACTIGLPQGPLSIAFLAGRTPVQPVENPRQVSAYHYPMEYGPRSPTFSRAVLVTLPERECLFISGTASIVGHRTVHLGDIFGQTREALANVEAVLTQANRLSRTIFTLGGLAYRVYIRHAEDFPAVRDLLSAPMGTAVGLCVQADICRQDLLVEIEAVAVNVLGSV